jgi:hypothetical protein
MKDGSKAETDPDRDAHLGRAGVEQRQRRAVADQHDRAAAAVRISVKSMNSTDQNEQMAEQLMSNAA